MVNDGESITLKYNYDNNGGYMMVKSPRLTPAKKAEIIHYLEQGYTLRSISQAIGCHINTICRYNKERKAALKEIHGGNNER